MKKWLKSGDIFTKKSEGTVTVDYLPLGIYDLIQDELGVKHLRYVGSNWKLPEKIYSTFDLMKLKHIMTTWNSPLYKENLGIWMNGLKGTGKTISAKVLMNQLLEENKIPIIVIKQDFGGIDEFLLNIDFECVVFIDEYEKIYNRNIKQEVEILRLLMECPGGFRKMFILTTNTSNINDNLISRPGRIRYHLEYTNISLEAVKEYLDDHLIEKSFTKPVIDFIGLLEISTMDILKSIVDEVNIHNIIPENFENFFNVNRSMMFYRIAYFEIEDDLRENTKDYIKRLKPIKNLEDRKKLEEDEDEERILIDTIEAKSKTITIGESMGWLGTVEKIFEENGSHYFLSRRYDGYSTTYFAKLLEIIEKTGRYTC